MHGRHRSRRRHATRIRPYRRLVRPAAGVSQDACGGIVHPRVLLAGGNRSRSGTGARYPVYDAVSRPRDSGSGARLVPQDLAVRLRRLRFRAQASRRHPGTHLASASDCTVVAGAERFVRAFTLDCEAAGLDGASSPVAFLLPNGQYISAAWRRRYTEYWGAAIIDRFALSEAFGGATEDPETGWYLFDPCCFPEVVALDTRSPISEGIGELHSYPALSFSAGSSLDPLRDRRSRRGERSASALGGTSGDTAAGAPVPRDSCG